jgi:cytochrome P450
LAQGKTNKVIDIHGHGAKVIKFKNYEILSRQAANLLTIRNKTLHAKRRRIISQAFSENNMRLFEPKIMTRVERFLDLLRLDQNSNLVKKDGWSEPIDMAHTCEFRQLR